MAGRVFQLLVRSYRSAPTFPGNTALDTPSRANKFAIQPVAAPAGRVVRTPARLRRQNARWRRSEHAAGQRAGPGSSPAKVLFFWLSRHRPQRRASIVATKPLLSPAVTSGYSMKGMGMRMRRVPVVIIAAAVIGGAGLSACGGSGSTPSAAGAAPASGGSVGAVAPTASSAPASAPASTPATSAAA